MRPDPVAVRHDLALRWAQWAQQLAAAVMGAFQRELEAREAQGRAPAGLRATLDVFVEAGEREYAHAAGRPDFLALLADTAAQGGTTPAAATPPAGLVGVPGVTGMPGMPDAAGWLAAGGVGQAFQALLAWLATRPGLWAEWQPMAERWHRGATRLAALQSAGRCLPGATPREAAWQVGGMTLWRYAPARRRRGPPLLISYALVNRPEVLDLEPGRSLIGALVARGHEVWLLDWGTPAPRDPRTLEDLVTGGVAAAMDATCRLSRARRADLLGVCQGGALALAYAAQAPARLRRLVTLVTPVTFREPRHLLGDWARAADLQAYVDRHGNVPGALLNAVFVALMPFRLGLQKYFALADHPDDEARLITFGRMERWIFDSPDQPGTACAQFVQACYREDALWNGRWTVGGRPALLEGIAAPVLNIYALRDHLVPAAHAAALARRLPPGQYQSQAFDGGHIGVFTSARAAGEIAPRVAGFLRGG